MQILIGIAVIGFFFGYLIYEIFINPDGGSRPIYHGPDSNEVKAHLYQSKDGTKYRYETVLTFPHY